MTDSDTERSADAAGMAWSTAQNKATRLNAVHAGLTRAGTAEATVQEVIKGGREYLVFPVIAAREMVLNYPEWDRHELLPAERLRESAPAWAGIPLTFEHPANGQASAASSSAYTSSVIGQAHDPEIVDGTKLRVNAWVDVEKAESLGGPAAAVVAKLRQNAELSVSAGYLTIGDDPTGGVHDGEPYDVAQGQLIPDHIAVFPSDAFRARCSPEDGCAAPRANAATVQSKTTMTEELTDEHATTFGWRVLNALGLGSAAAAPDAAAGQEEARAHQNASCTCAAGSAVADSSEAATGESCTCTTTSDHEPEAPVTNAESADEHDDEQPDAAPEADGADTGAGADADDEITTEMSEYDIDLLVEQSAFDAETLAEWDDEQLAALDATLAQASDDEPSDETESTAPDAESEASGPTAAEPETTTSPAGADTAATEALVAEVQEMKENYATLESTIQDLRETRETEAKRDDARIVANALDISEDEALEMPDATLEKLAEKHGQPRVNYAGVPGAVDRTPSSDVDEWPAGTRAEWKARTGGDE